MRHLCYVVVFALVGVGCNATERPAPTSAGAPPQPSRATTNPATTQVDTTPQPTTTSRPPTGDTTLPLTPGSQITGALPDGTRYVVNLDVAIERNVEGISAAIALDLEDGTSPILGITQFWRHHADKSLHDLTYTVPSDTMTVNIQVYPHIADIVGADLQSFLDTHISVRTVNRLPVVDLTPPLRWATDDEVPLVMAVDYRNFSVLRGCGPKAAACSVTGAVQVIPGNLLYGDTPGLPDGPVWVESPSPRPTTTGSYVEIGPLGKRAGHDIMWTGDEVLVWGGARGDRRADLLDGAAFDPSSSTWRIVAGPPIEIPRLTRAVWADTRMLLVHRDATWAYAPKEDSWTAIGDGLDPPDDPGFLVWTGEDLAAWNETGIHLFEPTQGTWTLLPDPGFGAGRRWEGALRVLRGDLYAVGTPGRCAGRALARWDGTRWRVAEPVSLQSGDLADCSYAHQSAVVDDRIVIWDDKHHLTMAYDPAADAWAEIAPIPLDGTEGPSGPVPTDTGFLVSQWGEGAIYDATTDKWELVVLPGHGDELQSVWTGSEFLTWGVACCYGDGVADFISSDAWRWSPP